MFGSAMVGVWLHERLPSHHLGNDSFEVVKLGAGMIATITALVLGLLVSSAKSTFDTISDGIKQGSARIILLDRALAQYGPDSQPVRTQLKRSIVAALETSSLPKPNSPPGAPPVLVTNLMETVQVMLRELRPELDAQRQALAQAQQLAEDIAQTRWLLMEEEQNELPPPLLVILILWLAVLFFSFGLFAPRNGTVITVLFVCALSMAAAIFLILEMNHPMDGFVKVSDAPLRQLPKYLGR